MTKIYSPNDELELSMIRGFFDTESISYFVHNDNFGSIRVGPQIDLLNIENWCRSEYFRRFDDKYDR